jgi:hypothetical protein
VAVFLISFEKPIKPVKPVKPISDADWLIGLTTLIGYFEVPFSIGGTSSCSIISILEWREVSVNRSKQNQSDF